MPFSRDSGRPARIGVMVPIQVYLARASCWSISVAAHSSLAEPKALSQMILANFYPCAGQTFTPPPGSLK